MIEAFSWLARQLLSTNPSNLSFYNTVSLFFALVIEKHKVQVELVEIIQIRFR